MKIVFSLNQLDAYAMALSRHDHLYDVMRSYNGIADGEYYPKGKYLLDAVNSEFIIYLDDHETQVFSIKREDFDYQMVVEDCAILEAMWDVKNCLTELANRQPTQPPEIPFEGVSGKPVRATHLAKKIKHLKVLLNNFNW